MPKLNSKGTQGHRELPTYFWVHGILTEWAETGRKSKLPINAVYDSFWKLSRKYPHHFSDLSFDRSGKVVLSRELESILFGLGLAGVVSVQNPRYKYLQVDRGPSIARKKIEGTAGKDAWKTVNEMTKEFARLVKAQAK